jgi:quercetin dioxygenase-like cupin family protein
MEIASANRSDTSTSPPVYRTVSPGVELAVLRHHGSGGLSFLIRMAPGAHAPEHDHPGGEETYLISGMLRIGSHELRPGDYYYAPPGEIHDGYADAEHGAVFFVIAPGGVAPTAPLTAALAHEHEQRA